MPLKGPELPKSPNHAAKNPSPEIVQGSLTPSTKGVPGVMLLKDPTNAKRTPHAAN